jgi:hypothetical protein
MMTKFENNRFLTLLGALILSASLLGCGDSDDDKGGGDGDGDGDGGAADASMPMTMTPGAPVECGTETCTKGVSLPVPGAPMLEPCCTAGIDADGNASDAVCGAGVAGQGCGQVDAPGTPDPACPDETILTFALSGCCRPDGECGIQIPIGFGCLSRADPNTSMFGLSLAPMSCDPDNPGTPGGDDDAGADDAG